MHNRIVVSGLMMVAVGLISAAAWGAGSDFLGPWLNVDPNTRTLTRLDISQSGSDYLVAGYGSCHPTDCYWGVVDLHLMGYSISDTDYGYGLAVWKSGIGTTYLIINLEGDFLVAILYTVFAPGDGRESYRSISLLAKP